MTHCWPALPLVLLGISVNSAAALEVDPKTAATARKMAYQARAAYDAGDYDGAYEQATEAYRLVPAPTLALLEARALRQMNRWLAARHRYRLAAKPLPDGAPAAFERAREDAMHELEVLEAALPKLLLVPEPGSLDLLEIELRLDGKSMPSAKVGVLIPLDPGNHVVSYRQGDRVEQRSFEAFPGEVERITVAHSRSDGEDNENTTTNWRPYAGWAAIGVGTVGLGTGIVQGLRALAIKSELDEACVQTQCPSDARSDLREYRQTRDVSTVAYVVGFTSLAAGGALLWDTVFSDTELRAEVGYGYASLRGQF